MLLTRTTRRFNRAVRLCMHVLCGFLIAHLVFPLMRDAAKKTATIQWWMRKLCRILALQIRVNGNIHAGPTLFVANHVSWLDIVALLSMLPAVFVAKQEVARWPVFGGMAARLGTLFMRRGHPDASDVAADQMTWSLMRGIPVVVFPEGTSSSGETVQRFYARLFQSAIRARSSVQAIAIRYPCAGGLNALAPFVGEDNLMRHLWALLAEPTTSVDLHFCVPLDAGATERRQLANLTRHQIVAILSPVPQQPAEAVRCFYVV